MRARPPIVAMSFPAALARQEGWWVLDSLAERNNNPGNLRYGPWAARHGARPGEAGFGAFPTPDAGWAALHALLITGYDGLTVAQAVAKWAPPTENATQVYVQNVCAWTGLTPETVLTTAYLAQPLRV